MSDTNKERAFIEEFVEAWDEGMGGDSSLYRKAKAVLALAPGLSGWQSAEDAVARIEKAACKFSSIDDYGQVVFHKGVWDMFVADLATAPGIAPHQPPASKGVEEGFTLRSIRSLMRDYWQGVDAQETLRRIDRVLERDPASQQRETQEAAETWRLINPAGQVAAEESTCIKAWARINGYKPTVEGLLGYEQAGWRVVQPHVLPSSTRHEEPKVSAGEVSAPQEAAEVTALLQDAHNLLDGALGDTDFNTFEDEEEEREYAPIQVAARLVMQAIDTLSAPQEAGKAETK